MTSRIPTPLRTPSPLELPSVVAASSQKDNARPVASSYLATGVRSVLGASALRIPFHDAWGLTPALVDHLGTVAGWYSLGKGTVTVVTDESLFENGRLNQADNARFAYNLATLQSAPGQTIAFDEWSHGYQQGDTWWSILPSQFRLAFGIIAGALVLLLIGAAWRFGPALALPENTERTSHEYLTSFANLLERGNAARAAVRDLMQLAQHSAAGSVGLPDSASLSSIAARIRASGNQQLADYLIELERIAGFEQPTATELVRAASLAIDLRKEFARDGFDIGPRRSTARRSA
jgi:hypothetical protein